MFAEYPPIKAKRRSAGTSIIHSGHLCNSSYSTKMADKPAGPPSRPMKYPYTFTAKFSQFPLSYYFKNQWIWKYYFLSVAACVPVFYSIHKLANSPANVAKWAEIRRKEAAQHH
ncbi:reduction of Rh1 [Carabus blaptoides fortunei]